MQTQPKSLSLLRSRSISCCQYHTRITNYEICRLPLILSSASIIEHAPGGPLCKTLITKMGGLWRPNDNIRSYLTIEFKSWALFLAASVAMSDILKDWCLVGILEATSAMHISVWEEVNDILQAFLWDLRIFRSRCQGV